jgi:hypothetical protein
MLKSGVLSLLGKVGKFLHDLGVLSFLDFHQDEDSTLNMSVRVNLSWKLEFSAAPLDFE